MKEIVTQAAELSEKVRERRDLVLAILADPWPINAYGVFIERWPVVADLDQAIKELIAARDGIANANWPSPADYEGE